MKGKRYYVRRWQGEWWYITDGDKGIGIAYTRTRRDARRICQLLNADTEKE